MSDNLPPNTFVRRNEDVLRIQSGMAGLPPTPEELERHRIQYEKSKLRKYLIRNSTEEHRLEFAVWAWRYNTRAGYREWYIADKDGTFEPPGTEEVVALIESYLMGEQLMSCFHDCSDPIRKPSSITNKMWEQAGEIVGVKLGE